MRGKPRASQPTGPAPQPNDIPLDAAPRVLIKPGLEGRYGQCPIAALIPNPHAVQVHSKRQIDKLARSSVVSGVLAPVVIDESYVILAGHARIAACKANGDGQVPVVQVFGLSEAQKRHYLLSDNRIGQDARLDREKLADQLPDLTLLFKEAGFDLTDTGFEVAELDEIVLDFEDADDAGDPEDAVDPRLADADVFLQPGDVLQLGEHLLAIGDARDEALLDRLMAGQQAAAAFLDPPYNVKVAGIVGRGRVQHPEFKHASGEMARPEFVAFLKASTANVARVSASGAVHYVCMDWKHVGELVEAGESVYQAMLNLVCWTKTNAGQGGLYRNQHELIGVFRVGEERHRDNVQQGRFGRNRSNVWTYAGVNTFRAGRMEDLAAHPTVKPVGLVADALKDVTRRGELVLDTFVGSGTTLLAGERTGRRVRAVEIEPRYAQIATRRWEAMTGRAAVHVASGLSLDELMRERAPLAPGARPQPEQPSGPVALASPAVPRVRQRHRPPV